MNEFKTEKEELLEQQLMINYNMSLIEFKKLDNYTKDILIKGMYIQNTEEKNKVKVKGIF